jgi:hypothetical protein
MPQYQGVWTLEQQAQAQSNQQWVTDPNFKNTTLLLQADGTGSGSQNQTFLDGSTNNFFITRNGNTTQGSFSPFSQAPGYWGNYFNGSSSLITPTSSATPLALGSGDFTIEFWVNSAIPGSDVGILDNRAADGSSTGLGVGIGGSTGKIRLYSNVELFNAGVITANQFTHVAIVRSSSTGTVYINGISAGTISSWSTNFTDQGFKIGIGAGGNAMTGYISNFRFVKGTAVYTANFTPTTAPLTAITNTSLLTCQSNRFVDNSTNGYAITVNGGTPSVQAFGPFAPALQWTPDVVGGSGYFDGSGDYLSCSASASPKGTQNFTIEGWAYVPSAATDYAILIDNNSSGGFYLRINSSGQIQVIQTNIASILISSSSVKANSWNYFSVTRSGNTFNVYLNSTSVDATASSSVSFSTGTATFVGADYNGNLGFSGYMSSLRVVLGTATAPSSIPTAPFTAVTNTSLLLNYTNAGIYDGKMANNLETVGNAQVSTSVVKYGSGSMYFDGTGDWLLTPNGRNYINGTEPFTVEFWVNLPSTPSFWTISGAGSGSAILTIKNLTLISINPYGSGDTLVVTTSLSTGTWTHIAFTRNSLNRFDIWVNGVSAGNTTSTQSFGSPSYYVVGAADSGGLQNMTGYLDDFRITKACRYFANFTPPQQALPRQ